MENLFFKFGTAVKTRVIWIKNNTPIISACTISNIVPTGGAANAKQTFSFNIDFNGRPKIFNGQLTLTATSNKKVYSATVDTSTPPKEDGKLVDAKIVEEATGAGAGK